MNTIAVAIFLAVIDTRFILDGEGLAGLILFIRVYAKTKKEASKRSFERIVRRSFHFIGSFKLQKSEKLPN